MFHFFREKISYSSGFVSVNSGWPQFLTELIFAHEERSNKKQFANATLNFDFVSKNRRSGTSSARATTWAASAWATL